METTLRSLRSGGEPSLDQLLALDSHTRKQILTAAVPRGLDPYVPHPPHPPQALFLLDQGLEAFYGGAAGGGKSDALLMAALQYVDVPRYSALIIRRTYGDLTLPGAIMDRANTWLEDSGARPFQGKGWKFPTGPADDPWQTSSRITFGYVMYPRDVGQYKSAEFQMIGFDELTQFQEGTYLFMFSRIRRPAVACAGCGVMVEKVAPGEVSCVRDDEGRLVAVGDELATEEHQWVHNCGQSNYHTRCSAPAPRPQALEEYPGSQVDGTTLFDVPLRMRSASNPGDVGHAWVRDRFVDQQRRLRAASYYPAKVSDNPSLDQQSYTKSLALTGQVNAARLLGGDWDVQETGTMFRRRWFPIVEASDVPRQAKLLRYWDLAATEATGPDDPNDPDWTAGALLAVHEGTVWICHVARCRHTPGGVEAFIRQNAEEDGRRVPVRMEQEGGSGGVNTIDGYRRRVLLGYKFDGHRPRGDKPDRAAAWAGLAEHGHVRLVRGTWNRDFLDEAESFPLGVHDDQVDAVSGAFDCLVGHASVRIIA